MDFCRDSLGFAAFNIIKGVFMVKVIRLTHRMTIRFEPSEYEKMKADAVLRRMSIAEHIRDLVRGWKWELESQ